MQNILDSMGLRDTHKFLKGNTKALDIIEYFEKQKPRGKGVIVHIHMVTVEHLLNMGCYGNELEIYSILKKLSALGVIESADATKGYYYKKEVTFWYIVERCNVWNNIEELIKLKKMLDELESPYERDEFYDYLSRNVKKRKNKKE